MKKVLQFAGLISLVLAMVAFALMFLTPAIVLKNGNTQYLYEGPVALFGKKETLNLYVVSATTVTKPSPLAFVGFILLIVGFVIVALGFVLQLLKVNALAKIGGILNLVALVCLVLTGIFMFCVVPNFYAANGADVPDSASIGAGWVIGGILAICAGAFAILPAAAAFLGKKK